jgi:hypothetical protein
MKTNVQRALKALLIPICLCYANLAAQDAHYWTQHYGTRSILLSNSVIGGAEDLGAVFYNPARLGLIQNPAFLISADVYEWQRLKIEDAFGETADLSRSDFGGIPSLTAGTFKLGFLKGHRFAYSILIRQRLDFDVNYRNEVFGDVLEQFPGEENFTGAIRYRHEVQEQWFTLSWSWPVKQWLSVGMNMTGSLYDQKKGEQIDLQALTERGQTAIYNFDRNFSFTNYGLLWKAGVAAEFPRWRAGLTVTTPTLVVTGKGKYRYEEFFSGVAQESTNEDLYTTNTQNDIPTTHRTPWAIGLGSTFLLGRHKLHVSGEWYSEIPRYTLLQSQPHTSQSSGEVRSFQLVDELKAVVNAGIGAEFYLSEKISLYASGSTDFSAVGNDIARFSENLPVARNSVISADFYHAALGLFFDFPGLDLTLGTARTGARQNFARPIDFPEEGDEGDDGIFDGDEFGTLKWERWRLIFSISVPFLRDRLDKGFLDKEE